MDPTIPIADPNGPATPAGPVPNANPPGHVPIAQPASGAVQQPPAPPPRRSRQPRGLIPPSSNSSSSGAPALLQLAAAYPMYTEQRRSVNYFVPDSQMLFHVLGTCDQMMNATDRFLRSSPAWLPVVSQLYISVLWNVMVMRVYVNTGYASNFSVITDTLVNHLQIQECMIPGPLVPFFQALAAVNGPFEWIGDITPAMPSFDALWDATNFCPHASYARQIPIPAIILDQLYYFATWNPAANAQVYPTFEWYRNVFSRGAGATDIRTRLGPQLCGSLFTTQAQFDAARTFWSSALVNNFTRVNAAANPAVPLTDYFQLLGFSSQAHADQLNWFQHITTVMQKYCQYFNGSIPLKSISLTGLGAVASYGKPYANTATRAWIYPATAGVEPFTTTRFPPRREIPNELRVRFSHADHELEEQAEQFATLSHINVKWFENNATQNEHTAITEAHLYQGDYWTMMPHRHSVALGLKTQFAQIIASRYHQQAANRAE